MGLSALAALLTMIVAYMAQSPTAVQRLGRMGGALSRRARTYTGMGVAFLLLGMGFFLAGVPLDGPETMAGSEPTAVAALNPNDAPSLTVTVALSGMAELATPTITPVPASAEEDAPVSGAFGRPNSTLTAEAAVVVETPRTPTNTPAPASTATSSPTPTPSRTPTPTPSPTVSPTPTLTATPWVGPTAVVVANGRALWLRRSPGGQRLVPLADGEVVGLTGGRANQDGNLWQELRTGAGVVGWLESEFVSGEGE